MKILTDHHSELMRSPGRSADPSRSLRLGVFSSAGVRVEWTTTSKMRPKKLETYEMPDLGDESDEVPYPLVI